MAQNDLKPNYTSSEEDEEEEEEASASGSEDDQTSASDSDEPSDSASEPPNPKKTLISPPKSTTKPSSESDESASDTDSDSPPKQSSAVVVDPNVKPISSVPMESVKKSGSKSTSTPPPASKRPSAASAAVEKDPKKAKSSTAADDDSKKQLFQRLWSEEDEIVILKAMIDYKAEHGENMIANADMAAFHELIKKSLHVDVSRAQLSDKIRRLRKKYVNNVSREKNGKDRSFSKSHEQRGYELSKLLWGSGSISRIESNKKKGNGASTSNSGGVKLNGGVEGKEVEKRMDVSRFVRYGGREGSAVLPEEIVKAGMELVEGTKRVELEERWRSLKKQELELYVKKMELVKEQALVVLDAVNSSGN